MTKPVPDAAGRENAQPITRDAKGRFLPGGPGGPACTGIQSFGLMFGRALAELCRTTDDTQHYAAKSIEDLKRIAADPKTAHPRAAAAIAIVHCRAEGWDRGERVPKQLLALKEILDRTIGKATQHIRVEHVQRTPQEILLDEARRAAQDPHIFAEYVGRILEYAPEIRPVLEARLNAGPLLLPEVVAVQGNGDAGVTPAAFSAASGPDSQ